MAKAENFLIEVVKDRFSQIEFNKIVDHIKNLEKNDNNRQIIYRDDRSSQNEKFVISVQYGVLSIEEIKKFIQFMRNIEQNKPTRHINIMLGVPDKTVEQLKHIYDGIQPNFPIKGFIEFKK